jgi:hypothetical protein
MVERRFEGSWGTLDSETGWPWRRPAGGAGAILRRVEVDGDGGSGVFPAASVSKMDSRSESWLVREGAGGRGLLRSVVERWVLVEAMLCAIDKVESDGKPGLKGYGE